MNCGRLGGQHVTQKTETAFRNNLLHLSSASPRRRHWGSPKYHHKNTTIQMRVHPINSISCNPHTLTDLARPQTWAQSNIKLIKFRK